jgi:hypothetical protein
VYDDPRGPRQPRWGVRALWFLGLAWVSLASANIFGAADNAAVALLSLAGTIAGFGGAAICSMLGLRAWFGVGRRPR